MYRGILYTLYFILYLNNTKHKKNNTRFFDDYQKIFFEYNYYKFLPFFICLCWIKNEKKETRKETRKVGDL
jgi:hypothetical protein